MTLEGQGGWKLKQTESAKDFNGKPMQKGPREVTPVSKSHKHQHVTHSLLNRAKNEEVEKFTIKEENKNPPTWIEKNGKLIPVNKKDLK